MTLAVSATMPTAIAPMAAIIVRVPMVTAVLSAGERGISRTASLPGKALPRGDDDGENADRQKQKSKGHPSDWDHPNSAHARGTPLIAVAINHAAAIPIVGAGNRLAVRGIFWLGNNHFSKGKGYRADKHQQQNSEVDPSGCSHLSSALVPRRGHRANSTM